VDVTVTVNGRTSTVVGRFSYIPVDSGVPAAPSAPSQDAWTTHSVDMSWLDNSTNETSFEVRYRPRSGDGPLLSLSVPADTTTVTITGLRPGTRYNVSVRACGLAGCSPWSPAGLAITPRLNETIPPPERRRISRRRNHPSASVP
jgi:hypothetical protein